MQSSNRWTTRRVLPNLISDLSLSLGSGHPGVPLGIYLHVLLLRSGTASHHPTTPSPPLSSALSALCLRSSLFLLSDLSSNIIPAAAAKSLQSCPTLCDPHRWQPTRLPHPWDSPGKNTVLLFSLLMAVSRAVFCPFCQRRVSRRQGQYLPCSQLELQKLVQSPAHIENQETRLREGRKVGRKKNRKKAKCYSRSAEEILGKVSVL